MRVRLTFVVAAMGTLAVSMAEPASAPKAQADLPAILERSGHTLDESSQQRLRQAAETLGDTVLGALRWQGPIETQREVERALQRSMARAADRAEALSPRRVLEDLERVARAKSVEDGLHNLLKDSLDGIRGRNVSPAEAEELEKNLRSRVEAIARMLTLAKKSPEEAERAAQWLKDEHQRAEREARAWESLLEVFHRLGNANEAEAKKLQEEARNILGRAVPVVPGAQLWELRQRVDRELRSVDENAEFGDPKKRDSAGAFLFEELVRRQARLAALRKSLTTFSAEIEKRQLEMKRDRDTTPRRRGVATHGAGSGPATHR